MFTWLKRLLGFSEAPRKQDTYIAPIYPVDNTRKQQRQSVHPDIIMNAYHMAAEWEVEEQASLERARQEEKQLAYALWKENVKAVDELDRKMKAVEARKKFKVVAA